MHVDRLRDSVDGSVTVHRRHGLMEQVISVRRQDVESEDLSVAALHDRFEAAAPIPDRLGTGAVRGHATDRDIVSGFERLGLGQADGREGGVAEHCSRNDAVVGRLSQALHGRSAPRAVRHTWPRV